MEISSADFTKLTLQKVADMLLDHDANGVMCKGLVDGKMYSLKVELSIDDGDFEIDNTIEFIIETVEMKLNYLSDENEQLKLLLREVEHELTTLTGLTATDSTSIVKEDMEEYGLFRLDYTELLKKIYKELQE